MADNPNSPRERATTAPPNLRGIEQGWTVYDTLGRPVGNVSEATGDRLRVDGRPEGLGYLNLPLTTVRSAGDGEVHLSLRTEDFTSEHEDRDAAASTLSSASAIPGDAPRIRPVGLDAPEPTPAGGRRETLSGSSFTASGTPVGLGSNTPVGGEPDTFRQWDEDIADQGTNYLAWLAPVAVGAAGVAAYLWWRQRQARRRRPLARLTAALESVGQPAWRAARERPWAWRLAPLAILPLLYALRSSGEEEEPEPRWEPQHRDGEERSWREWIASRDLGNFGDQDEGLPLWALAVPVLGALAVAWLASRGRTGGAREGKRLRDIMTPQAQVARPETTLFEAASTMRRLDVGALPVCDGRKLQGMVTDRDIVVRAIADGRDPHLTSVADVMTKHTVWAFDDEAVGKGAALMRKHQIRRLPIVDRDKNLVGIVSLGDLAVDAGDDQLSGQTLEDVSEPAPGR